MAKTAEPLRSSRAAPNRDRILDAAERLFCEKGFHGTSTRDIARAAGVSLGNIYNHFPGKEELFEALLARHEAEYFRPDQPLPQAFLKAPFPQNIEAIGGASREMIERFSTYILLIYLDVLEFKARHIGRIFRDMRERYRRHVDAMGGAEKAGVAPDVDPAAAMMLVTLSYFNYFIVERLFGVKGHFGLKDDEVIRTFARIFRGGVARR